MRGKTAPAERSTRQGRHLLGHAEHSVDLRDTQPMENLRKKERKKSVATLQVAQRSCDERQRGSSWVHTSGIRAWNLIS